MQITKSFLRTNDLERNLSKKPLFSGLGEAGGVNFGCRGENEISLIFEILHKTKIWSIYYGDYISGLLR